MSKFTKIWFNQTTVFKIITNNIFLTVTRTYGESSNEYSYSEIAAVNRESYFRPISPTQTEITPAKPSKLRCNRISIWHLKITK